MSSAFWQRSSRRQVLQFCSSAGSSFIQQACISRLSSFCQLATFWSILSTGLDSGSSPLGSHPACRLPRGISLCGVVYMYACCCSSSVVWRVLGRERGKANCRVLPYSNMWRHMPWSGPAVVQYARIHDFISPVFFPVQGKERREAKGISSTPRPPTPRSPPALIVCTASQISSVALGNCRVMQTYFSVGTNYYRSGGGGGGGGGGVFIGPMVCVCYQC